jgi:hypothetical protein
MRLNVGMFNWGVFFITLGAVPLLVTQDIISGDIEWWSLWPFILVGIGVGLVVQRTLGDLLGGLIVALTVGVMLGGLASAAIEGGFSGIGGIARSCGSESASDPFPTQQGELTGSSADVQIQLSCGDIDVATQAGTGWRLEGTNENGEPPRIESSSSGLLIAPVDDDGFVFPTAPRSSWQVTLPTGPRLDLRLDVNAGDGVARLDGATLDEMRLDVNAGSGRVDLSGATADRLRVQVNAGSAVVSLPSSDLTGSLQVNAGSISICAPGDVALRLTMPENIIGSNNFGSQGLTRSGDTWESPGYATAANQIDLRTEANAGSVELNHAGGCQ